MKKKTAKKSTKKKAKEEVSLVLDGKVLCVVKKNGKIVEEGEIDGTVVLQVLLRALEEAIKDVPEDGTLMHHPV